MLISREELEFDFKGAEFDLEKESDRKLLGWVFNQFLYGEVTGIQCGYWLYRAPHLNAAAFIAKQASEELSHVKRILRILTLLREEPGPPHGAIRFLSTGMMGGSWGEHVTLEMAIGEGLVLSAFYAMEETIPDPAIKKILSTAVKEEETHVDFGEKETKAWLAAHPYDRKRLLGLVLFQLIALKKLKGFVLKKLLSGENANHPVLSQFVEFYDHVIRMMEVRIDRLGLSTKPISQYGLFEKIDLLLFLPFRKIVAKFRGRTRLLTDSYLNDPSVASEKERLAQLSNA